MNTTTTNIPPSWLKLVKILIGLLAAAYWKDRRAWQLVMAEEREALQNTESPIGKHDPSIIAGPIEERLAAWRFNNRTASVPEAIRVKIQKHPRQFPARRKDAA